MSSLDGYRAAQPEPSSYDRIVFPETPSRDAVITTQPSSTSPHLGRQSLDLRDVVKDSMYREARGLSLSVKTPTKEEAFGLPLKHKDSPRPCHPSKIAAGNDKKGKQSADMRESLKVLAKLREAPWYYNETRERDGGRFSYDGREMNRLSFESRDTIKSSIKLKELPRLSLDSREKSMWDVNSNSNAHAQQQESLGTHKRPPSVVAKLMGLEALPDSAVASTSQSTFISTNDVNRPPIRVPKSPRSLSKEPNSPRWKNPDLIMKPISRLPIEPAPWKQAAGFRASQKPSKFSAKTLNPNPFPTVYSEIEKRLKDLEFNQSGKDLRALKQILEAMQANGFMETRNKERGSNFGNRNDRNGQVSAYDSPIVIMKPAKLVEKSGVPSSSVIPIDGFNLLHKTPSNGHTENRNRSPNTRTPVNSTDKKTNLRNRSTQSTTRPQQPPKDSAANSVKSTGSVSPRLQQKKLELERKSQSRPPTPPDLTKPRRQSGRMSTESSSSPGGKNRPKSHKLPHSDDQLSQISNESRTSSHQGDDASQQSDNTVVLDLKTDVEVSSVSKKASVFELVYSIYLLGSYVY